MNAETKPVSSAALHRPVLLVSLGLTFLIFSLPIYAKELGASAVQIGGLYSIFTLAALVLRPLVGWGLDRFGRKRFFVAGLAGYALAMVLFSQAGDLPGLYLARLVNGIAAALTWIASTTIVADLALPEGRARAIGRLSESGARGEMIGAFAGFMLLNLLPVDTAWPVVFGLYALAAAAGAWLAWRKVPETRPAARPAGEGPSGRPVSPAFAWLLAIVFTTALSQALASPIYLIYLQDRFTADAGLLALAFLPGGFLFTILPSRMGGLSDRVGRVPLMALGLIGTGLLFLLLPQLPSLSWLVLLYTLTAVGWSMSVPAETALVADLAGSGERGRRYGMYEFATYLGATLGPLAGGWLYDNAGQAAPFYLAGSALLLSAGWVLAVLSGREIRPAEA